MSPLTEILLFVAIIALLLPAAVSFACWNQVRRLSSPDLHLQPIPRPSSDPPGLASARDGWARENGFEPIGRYLMEAGQTCHIDAWQHMQKPTLFCVYTISAPSLPAPRVFSDLVTVFAEERSLTTASTKDAHFFPVRDGIYMQSFPDQTLGELWHRHLDGERYLVGRGLREIPRPDIPFEQHILQAIHKQMAYVRAIPCWPLFASYWFWVRRNRLANLTIEEQHRRGWIRLPGQPEAGFWGQVQEEVRR
ncbi:MAG: hypothetical protein HYU36_25025 [Planctomycetes bacterium]|nr:hypothetical protein [Planctomycetota bacterium]